MRKIFTFFLLASAGIITAQVGVSSTPHTITYRYGHNGMEYIVTSKKETVIISTYNSKFDIKEEIAKKVYDYYDNNRNYYLPGHTLIIDGKDAKVTGKYRVTKKGKLVAVDFYYEKIEWNNGLTELYKKNLG